MTGASKPPWTRDATLWLVSRLWPKLEALVNRSESEAAVRGEIDEWREVRQQLDEMAKGNAPFQGWAADAPIALTMGEDGFSWGLVERSAKRESEPVGAAEFYLSAIKKWTFTTMLLWDRAIRPRLKRCAQCARYRLLRRARTPKGSRRFFCSQECRGLWRGSAEARAADRKRKRDYDARNPSRRPRSRRRH
jgi:hypothetical protein